MAQPELRRQRVVLFSQDPRRGRLVAAASPLAMQADVRVSMPLSEAQSLLQRATRPSAASPHRIDSRQPTTKRQSTPIPQPIVNPPSPFEGEKSGSMTCGGEGKDSETGGSFFIFEHDPAADLRALNELADALSQFSPIIGLEQADSTSDKAFVSSIMLDFTNLARLFGSEEQLTAELFQFIHALDYVPRLAIANTIGMAWGASRFGMMGGTSFCSAPTAADACLIIPPEDPEIFLRLPIESLRLATHTIGLLHQLGIKTNEQLWQLPRTELAMRFGNEIHRRIDQATGKLSEPVIARPQATELAATQLLEHPTHHRETIEVVISRLVNQICQQLRTRQQGGLQWLITLMLVDEPALRLSISLFQASATAAEIMPLVEMQLEQQLNRPKNSNRQTLQVQEIRVAVTSAVLLVPYQRPLFDESPQLNRQALAQLINRLTSRLGQPQVVYPQLLSGAQPELSYRFRPLVDIQRRRRPSKTWAAQSHVAGRPLRIFNPAIELEFISCPVTPSPPAPLPRRGEGGGNTLSPLSRSEKKDSSPNSLSSHPSIPSLPVEKDASLASIGAAAIVFFPPSLTGDSLTGDSLTGDSLTGDSLTGDSLTGEKGTTFSPLRGRGAGGEGRNKIFSIIQATGPERIETGWWRGPTVYRDYWRIETEEGQSLWIYRDLREKRWFLQGEF